MSIKALLLVVVVSSLWSAAAFGHHSGAVYDAQTVIEVEATVKGFEWTNPHSWLQISYRDANNRQQEIDLELGSPAQLARQGWRPSVVAAGDAVSLQFHPHGGGAATGLLITLTLEDGRTLTSD